MFSLVLYALRARRAQALAMFALAALASLGASAAPWFLAWGSDSVARSAVAAAPVYDRLVLGTSSASPDSAVSSPLDTLRATVEQHLPISGSELDVGARIFATVETSRPVGDEPAGDEPGDEPAGDETGGDDPAASVDMYLVAWTNICDHLRLVDGACPTAPGDVALGRDAAVRLDVGVGDTVTIGGFQVEAAPVRVSGVYEVADPYEPYWVGTTLLRELGATDAEVNPAVAAERTLLDLRPNYLQFDIHMLLPDAAFIDPGLDLRGTLLRGEAELADADQPLNVPAHNLLDRIARDRLLVVLGVTVGAGQLVLVSWVALFLAVRHTSEERRADVGLLKLRGATPRRVASLIVLSSGIPMLAGTVFGAAAGFVAAAALAYRSAPDLGVLAVMRTSATDPRISLLLSLAAAAVAGLGGLVAAVMTEARTLRSPVVELLRRVPGGHRGWRADVAELVVVALAGAGVYQGWVDARAGVGASVLALLAPALVALAVALIVARAMPLVAARVGTSALRAGRVGAALAALQLARRPGTQRVFAVLAVATAVFTTMTILWQSATTAWHQRALQELGADRVLSVEAPGAAALLNAVRSVDPNARYAMAVATTSGVRAENRVVAVDATRYATVGRMPDGLPAPADLAALVRPSAIPVPSVTNAPLTLDVTAPDHASVGLRLHLSSAAGQSQTVEFPELPAGRGTVQTGVNGCLPSCRLVAIEVVSPDDASLIPTTVEIHELRQPAGTVLDGQTLGDIGRWRTTLVGSTIPPTVVARDGRLAITIWEAPAPDGVVPDHRVLPLATPLPVPVAMAGPPSRRRDGVVGISALGGSDVPFVVAARVPMLPVVGGRGVLVDLEYALRSNDEPAESVDLSVWLTADAPDSLVAALADYGVTVLDERSVAQRAAQLAGQAPGLALWFGYFAAAVVLLLAAGVAVVGSTVDRAGRVAELVALRRQGLSMRPLWTAGLAGTAVMVGAAALTGVATALAADALASSGLPAFADGWSLLPRPGLTGTAVMVAVAVTVIVLGVASLTAASRLVSAAGRVLRDAAAARADRTEIDDSRHQAGPSGRGRAGAKADVS